MHAIIISIGNELLNGKTVNSNATFIGARLYEIGIPVKEIITVGDEAQAITRALEFALGNAEIIILTGGLGPTHDDITKKTIASFFNSELVFDKSLMRHIEERFRRRGMQMPAVNRNQALVPHNARIIENKFGTAPGIHYQQNEKQVFILPGVPREMREMIQGDIIPNLRRQFDILPRQARWYRTTGIAESRLYEICEDIFREHPDYEVAFLPKFTGVDIRISVSLNDASAEKQYVEFETEIRNRIGKYIYAYEDKEIEEVIGELLAQKHLTLAIAESCTGGLVQDRITNVPGSSNYFMGGLVSYSNESKVQHLGVSREALEKFGAVSEIVAREMAEGVRQKFHSEVGLSTTGIAGPGGATPEKPVGLIYVGLATPDGTIVKKFNFGDDRLINKERGAQAALELLRRWLLGIKISNS